MEVTTTPKTYCKSCFHEINDHESATGEKSKPFENDLSICISCGTLSRFDKNLNLIPLTDDQIQYLYINDYKNWLTLQRASNIIKKRINGN